MSGSRGRAIPSRCDRRRRGRFAVGQIAKLMGCRTVGLTGGPQKVQLCTEEFGYDARSTTRPALSPRRWRRPVRRGIDVYFDNTPARSVTVMTQLALGARVVMWDRVDR